MTNTQSPAPGVAAEALKELLDGIHAGRFVPLANSGGYCKSLVDNAEEALAALQASAAAMPVAWRRQESGLWVYYETKAWDDLEPLYTAPPLPAQVQEAEETEPSEIESVIACLGDDAAQLRGENPDDERAANMERAAELLQELASRTPAPGMAGGVVADKLWLWKNFVDGKPEYWAFDNPFPINLDDADPQTLGEPCGYAIFKPSRQGRTDVGEEQVLRDIAGARPEKLNPPTERDGLTSKEAWWAGYREGKGLPPDTPRHLCIDSPGTPAPQPSPAPQAAGAIPIPYVTYDSGKPELWLGYMDKQGCYTPVAGPDPVPASWFCGVASTTTGRAGS